MHSKLQEILYATLSSFFFMLPEGCKSGLDFFKLIEATSAADKPEIVYRLIGFDPKEAISAVISEPQEVPESHEARLVA